MEEAFNTCQIHFDNQEEHYKQLVFNMNPDWDFKFSFYTEKVFHYIREKDDVIYRLELAVDGMMVSFMDDEKAKDLLWIIKDYDELVYSRFEKEINGVTITDIIYNKKEQ